MNWLETFRVSFRSIGRNKMRSFLTMLGIIIGVAAVIAMVSVGEGARVTVEDNIKSLGSNLIQVFPWSMRTRGVHGGLGSRPSLTEEDYLAIKSECLSVAAVSPMVRTNSQVVYENQNWFTSIQGVSPEFLQIRGWTLEIGSNFTDSDVRGATKVAILGKTVVKNLFGDENADPVGKVIRIRKFPFTVIGVLTARGYSAVGFDQDDLILVPYTTVQRRLIGDVTRINIIFASAIEANAVQQAQEEITQVLRRRHRIQPGDEDDFSVRNQMDIASTATETTRIMTILLGSIASISLIVGGIGIMNIMLVSVTERTREIGIRMAVGAKQKDILIQFLTEAMALSLVGGIIGIILGGAASQLIARFAGWRTFVSINSIFLAFFFSASVGIFFGFYPARKASLLNPIDALRYE
ncbi:MAG: ABC transporter permease [Candidatus Aminicenantia bacterium]